MWTEFNALIQMGQIISIKNCLQYLASGLGPVIWSITGNNSRSTWFYGPPSRHATGTVEASAGFQVCNHDTRLLQFFFSFSKAWSLEVALNISFYFSSSSHASNLERKHFRSLSRCVMELFGPRFSLYFLFIIIKTRW